jgi:glyoxylase-like metal-dependent hydrolase (beta-lactamase superfamily II)
MKRDSLRCVQASNASLMTLDGTRTFLVGRERPVVIDPGPDEPVHLKRVMDVLGGRTPLCILLTHRHADHAGGAARLADRTGAPLRAATAEGGAEPLADGETIETDVGTLQAIATPGHTPDHLAFLWEGPEGRAVFTGDLVMGEGATALVAEPEGHVAAYLASLERVRSLDADRLYPTHGHAIEDPAAALDRYRAHRESRIAQVRQVLAAHEACSPADLLDEVYGADLHPKLAAHARGSIAAILTFLEGRGEIRVGRDGCYHPAS